MGIEFLKRSKPESEKAEDDAKVRAVVETTLTDIAARGDVAVRELSKDMTIISHNVFASLKARSKPL